MTEPVSVIIPTYNGERYLKEAVASVLSQTISPLEIVVVDDCSTDGTWELAESLSAGSPVPMKVVKLEKNSGGPAVPINTGIRESVGEFITVLDQDDVLLADSIESRASALASDSTIRIAFTWAGQLGDCEETPLQVEADRSAILRSARNLGEVHHVSGQELLRYLVGIGYFLVGFPAFMFRRDDWEAKGGVAEHLKIATDMEFAAWLFARGDAAAIPRVGYLRREHQNNACRRRAEMATEICRVRLQYFDANTYLSKDEYLRRSLLQQVESVAYWLREGGCYLESASLYRLCGQLHVSRHRLAFNLAKVYGRRVFRQLTRTPVVKTAYTHAV